MLVQTLNPAQSINHCNGSTKFAISASILYDLLVLKFPWIGLNVRFIVLQTLFSAELDVLLRKKLRYSFSLVNVSRYCYMAWKPVCLTSIRLPLLILSLTDFFMKLFKTNNIEIVKACQEFFGFQLPSVQIAKRTTKFEIQFQERSRLIKL